jgi:hypothetical protein
VKRAAVILLGLGALAVASVLGVQVVRAWPTWKLLRRTAMKERIRVPEGEPLDPESIVLSVGADGGIFRDGLVSSAADLKIVLAKAQGVGMALRRDPVLLELHPESRIRDFKPVYEACCLGCWINLSFLVETPSGPRAIPFPVPMDITREDRYSLRGEQRKIPEKDDRLRVLVEAEAGGACRVERLFQDQGHVILLGDLNDPQPWTGAHPPLGVWSMEALRAFLDEPRVRALDPRVMLRLEGRETAADAIRSMADLRSVVGDDLLVVVANPE